MHEWHGAPRAVAEVRYENMLVSYIRQLAVALVAGLDAVFAQVNFGQLDAESKTAARAATLRRSATLQSAIVFYFIGFLILSLTDIINLWLGDRVIEAGSTNAEVATLVLILLPGMMAISLSENWTMTMTGGGYLTRYIFVILSVALLNPICVFFVLYGLDFERSLSVILIAIAFSVLHFLCYLVLLPRRASKILDISLSFLSMPIGVTLFMATGAVALALLARGLFPPGTAFFTDVAVLGLCFLLTARFYLLPLMRDDCAATRINAP